MSANANIYDPVTVDEFLEYFPEFKDVPTSAIQFQLNLSMKLNSKAAWGIYWREAVMLDAAHELAITYNISAGIAEAGKNGPIFSGFTTSESASPGSLSRGSQIPAWMTGDDILDGYYGRTIYGQRYLILLIRVIPAGLVVFSRQIERRGTNPYNGYWSVTEP